MPSILSLYSKYQNDGLVGSDIVDLIKVWARIPYNEPFVTIFLPEVYHTIS
jgi:hypothetical protein